MKHAEQGEAERIRAHELVKRDSPTQRMRSLGGASNANTSVISDGAAIRNIKPWRPTAVRDDKLEESYAMPMHRRVASPMSFLSCGLSFDAKGVDQSIQRSTSTLGLLGMMKPYREPSMGK